jgi:hypothetical protein
MFREIRTTERITEEDMRRREREQNYLKIKPETEMSMAEINEFWNQVFQQAHDEAVNGTI